MTESNAAADVEAWLDQLDVDPSEVRDATHMRRIAAARHALDDAEAELLAAGRAARAVGDSWAVVGVALGVSARAAEARFGEHRRPST